VAKNTNTLPYVQYDEVQRIHYICYRMAVVKRLIDNRRERPLLMFESQSIVV